MNKKLISLIVIVVLLSFSGCKGDTSVDESIKIDSLNIEVDSLKNEIEQLNEQINNKEIDQSLISSKEMTYKIKEIQVYHGVMDLVGNENIRILPYRNSLQLSSVNSGKVEVIATVLNGNEEEWVLVKSLDPNNIDNSPIGYVEKESLELPIKNSSEENSSSDLPNFQGVSIGMPKDEIIKILGEDYVEIETGEGYFIHYFGDSLPIDEREYNIEGVEGGPFTNLETGVDLFIDFKTNTISGFRIMSDDYSLFDLLNVGDNMDEVIEICLSTYEKYIFSDLIIDENQIFFDLGSDYLLDIVTDPTTKKVQAFYVVKKDFYY